MDSLPENKTKEMVWGFCLMLLLGRGCVSVSVTFLMASLGVVMVDGKCSMQFYFLFINIHLL